MGWRCFGAGLRWPTAWPSSDASTRRRPSLQGFHWRPQAGSRGMAVFEAGSGSSRACLRAAWSVCLWSFALAVYPAIGEPIGHTYPASPTFGLPCPTTLFTFGILLMAAQGLPRAVIIAPLVWAIIGSAAAFALGVSPRIWPWSLWCCWARTCWRGASCGAPMRVLIISISPFAGAKLGAACKHERPFRPRLLPASACGRGRHACGKPRRFHLK